MRKVVTGSQVAQLRNTDPFAVPLWRAPIYRTPFLLVAFVQAARVVGRLVRFLFRHPAGAFSGIAAVLLWRAVGWPVLASVAAAIALVVAVWRWRFPSSFSHHVVAPARARVRAWQYRRRWGPVMTIARLAPVYQGRTLVPVLGNVSATRFTDRVLVRLVSGQSPDDFAARAPNLAHGFGAVLCRIRSAAPGAVLLEFVRRDALAVTIPALPIGEHVDLRALPVGKREDGQPWHVQAHGAHVLIAGSTGAGKAALLWSIVRAMLPALRAGLVRVWASDPKLMEQLRVRQALQRADGKLRIVEPKTSTSRRTVVLPRLAIRHLREHRKRQNVQRLALGEAWREHGLVFASTIGTPIEPRNINRRWDELRERAGLDGLRLHDLRHGCATFMQMSRIASDATFGGSGEWCAACAAA